MEDDATIFGPKKTSGYSCNYKNLDLVVRKRAIELYKIFYLHHEENGVLKVCNNEFTHQLCWKIVVEQKVLLID